MLPIIAIGAALQQIAQTVSIAIAPPAYGGLSVGRQGFLDALQAITSRSAMRPVPPPTALGSAANCPPRRLRSLPVGLAQQLDVVDRAARYFSHHFSEEIELEAVARSIGVSAEWLDICFDHCRGKTPFQTLQHIRLSRLFEGIASQPHSTLKQQVHRCGLASVMAANRLFEELFGIGLAPFRRVCRQAEADRQLRQWSC